MLDGGTFINYFIGGTIQLQFWGKEGTGWTCLLYKEHWINDAAVWHIGSWCFMGNNTCWGPRFCAEHVSQHVENYLSEEEGPFKVDTYYIVLWLIMFQVQNLLFCDLIIWFQIVLLPSAHVVRNMI